MDKELEEWLQNAKSKGYTNKEIIYLLKERGYSERAIKDILNSIGEINAKLDIKPKISRINKSLSIKLMVGMLVFLAIIFSLLLISTKISNNEASINPERVEKGIDAQVAVETIVNGNIEVRLPESKDGKIMPSNKTLNKAFQVRSLSNGIFIDNYRVLMPSSVVPDEHVKIKALDSLNILKDVNKEYKNSYATLNSISKDIFVIWKDQDLVVAKGNLQKTELMGDRGISIIKVENFHKEYAIFDKDAKGAIKFDVFFKNRTEDYDIYDYRFSLKISEEEFSGAKLKAKDMINGAAAFEDGKIKGIFYVNNEDVYFISPEILESMANES